MAPGNMLEMGRAGCYMDAIPNQFMEAKSYEQTFVLYESG